MVGRFSQGPSTSFLTTSFFGAEVMRGKVQKYSFIDRTHNINDILWEGTLINLQKTVLVTKHSLMMYI